MLKYFRPTWMLEKIYLLDSADMEKNHIKGIITDLDNTLIAWNNPDGTEELRDWLADMDKADIPIVILSNNSEDRVRQVAKQFNIQFHAPARKPLRRGFKRALDMLDMDPDDVVIIGDQLLTDIFGANRLVVRSIMVLPIVKTDSFVTRINRFFERLIFKLLKEKHPELIWRRELGE
nr:YqeG family HAD IIIA-type phosphatase [Aerococcus urinaehominis]